MKIYKEIKKHAQAIAVEALGGCKKAQQVIDLHQMCVRSADVPTVALLGAAYDEWKNQVIEKEIARVDK